MSKAEDLRRQLVRSFATPDESWRTFTRAPHYESAGVRLARGTAAKKLGMSVDIVPPGKRACPYHFHYAEEEAFIVLEGNGTLRVAGELLPITAGDVIFIPPGPEYPHQILNTSDTPLKYLSLSVNADLEICEYPDSGKYLAMASGARGRSDTLLQDGRMHRVASDLDYWDGEA